MTLHHLVLSSITEDHLAQLVTDRTSESKTIEFKQALEIFDDKQRRELLCDITALANSDGGDIIYGVKEADGVAAELVGLKGFVPDDSLGKIENLLRDGVQPRLSGVILHCVDLENGNKALIVRVPRSFAAPHMVRHQGVTRFCGRNSNGKYDLDAFELRSAFLASEGIASRLRSFRLDRINRLISGDLPARFLSESLIVLHVLPVIAARPGRTLSASDLAKVQHSLLLKPMVSNGSRSTFNFDGLLFASKLDSDTYTSTVQVFRTGFLESINGATLGLANRQNQDRRQASYIPGSSWEERILEVFGGYLEGLELLGLSGPYAVSVSLLRVKGFYMGVSGKFAHSGFGREIDRDHLLSEEVLLEDPTRPAEEVLAPIFDQVWNACGWPKSMRAAMA